MKKVELTKISVVNIEYYSYHGVKKEEKKLGGRYQVDIHVWYDATKAILNDNVNSAINYEEIVFTISELMIEESYDLIETIASEILNALFDKFSMIQKSTVVIRKLTVPMRRVVDHVSVEQTMERPTE